MDSTSEADLIWKHTTAKDVYGKQVGIDLFDDGTRWPARTLTPGAANFHECLMSWLCCSSVNDYRGRKDMDIPKIQYVYAIVDRTDPVKRRWVRIGKATYQPAQGTLEVVLDALPIDGKLYIRDAEPSQEG